MKNTSLYCYRNPEDLKAECLIHMPGFAVSPAPECKSKKFAFKVSNLKTSFHFASDSQRDMNSWMNKIGLAAIAYTSRGEKNSPNDLGYSETEESDDGTPANNRKQKCKTSCPREASPGSSSTSSSASSSPSFQRVNYGRSSRTSTSSSSTTLSSSNQGSSAAPPAPKSVQSDSNSTHSQRSTSCNRPVITPFQSTVSYYRSPSLDSANVLESKAKRQQNLVSEESSCYAKLSFPPPSPGRSKKFVNKVPARSPKPALPARLNTKPASMDKLTDIKKNFDTLSNHSAPPGKPTIIEANCINKQPPKPQPRTSILKSQTQPNIPKKMELLKQDSSESGCSSGNSSLNATLEKKDLKSADIKRIEQFNPIYNSIIFKSSIPGSFSEKDESKFVSVLDKEYNKLFGRDTAPSSKAPMSATSREIFNLYTPKPRTVFAHTRADSESSCCNANEDALCGKTDQTPQRSVSATKMDRSHSPISDNSLSSSSGISSYYSAHQEIPSSVEPDKSTVSLCLPLHLPGHLPLEGSLSAEPNAHGEPGDTNLTTASPSPKSTSSSSKNSSISSSFRLFSSPKLLKKFSTPKYQKERHQEKVKSDVKITKSTPDAQKSPTSKTSRFFLNSPKLTRAFFGSPGIKKAEKSKVNSISAGVQTDDLSLSDSSSYTSSPSCHSHGNKSNPKSLSVPLPSPSDPVLHNTSDTPLTPDTPRKPAMGISILGKRRPSNVSSDKASIELALQQYNNGTSAPSPHGLTDEDEWNNIAKTIREAGLSLENHAKQNSFGSSVSSDKPLDDESMCHLVLSLRSYQRTLKVIKYITKNDSNDIHSIFSFQHDKQNEINAIDELLKEPISSEKLHNWLKLYPDLLPKDYCLL